MPVAEISQMAVGFWGKIPSRGDFVGVGLSPGFVAGWDEWVSRGIAASRQALGDRWAPAWMEAPVWCFSAAAGLFCGDPAIGLWMPSVDRAGRHFPLVIAAFQRDKPEALPTPEAQPLQSSPWFLAAESAGRAALAEMLEPDRFFGRISRLDDVIAQSAGSTWWTEGGPRVAPSHTLYDALPDPNRFARLLEDAA